MKPTLLFATLSMVFATPTLFAKSELETLRARCAEQERQIQQLEQDNSKLRSATTPAHTLGSQNELISTAAAKPVETAKPAEATKPTAAPGSTTYIVKAGDSLEKIASAVSTSPASLAKSNGLKTNAMIHPGQKLKVPGTAVAAATSEPAAAPAKAPAAATASSGKSYKVRENDTFSSISRKQKISVAALIAANPKVKPTALRTGQIISLGASKSATTEAPAPAPIAKSSPPMQSAPVAAAKAPAHNATTPVLAAKSPTPVAKTHEPTVTAKTAPVSSVPAHSPAAKTESAPATAAQESSSPNPEKKIHPVTIDGEMTYGEFATKHGTDPERLNALNGLDLSTATVLAKGSELYVPAQP